jgi:hypothetical protein
MRKSPTVVLMSAVGLLLTQSANSAPPTSPIIGEAATARPVPPGGTNVPGGNKITYVGPTPDLTAVANAIQVQAKSLTSLVTVGSGLALARPVTISIAYLSAWPTGSDRVTQTYVSTSGNRFVRVDLEGDGKPRKLHLDITLSESNPAGGVYSFNVPTDLALEPLYDVAISPVRFTLLENCNPIGDGNTLVTFYWITPDKQRQNVEIGLKARQQVRITDFAWHRNEVGASANLNPPTYLFRTDNMIDLNEILGGFAPGLGASNNNLVPGKTRYINPGLENAVNENTCKATIEYTMTYELRTYFGGPAVRDHR